MTVRQLNICTKINDTLVKQTSRHISSLTGPDRPDRTVVCGCSGFLPTFKRNFQLNRNCL
jgi:hypothetical protein